MVCCILKFEDLQQCCLDPLAMQYGEFPSIDDRRKNNINSEFPLEMIWLRTVFPPPISVILQIFRQQLRSPNMKQHVDFQAISL